MTNGLGSEPADRIAVLVQEELGREGAYHGHKETMAYFGLALFVAAIGAVLISKEWPPDAWGDSGDVIGAFALSILWYVVLIYLRFQLRLRRRTALRVAGLQNVLVKWATGELDLDRLQAIDRPAFGQMSLWQIVVDWVCPLQASVIVINGSRELVTRWPGVLVDAWIEAETNGTDAIHHERLIILSGWLLFVASIIRTSLAA